MTLDDLYKLAQRHHDQVWGQDSGELGAGDLVLGRYEIDPQDFTRLALDIALSSSASRNPDSPALAALVLQGFVFGLWAAEQLGVRSLA